MSLKVTFKHPDFENGHEFEVVGLGLLKNGQTKTVSEEDEQRFLSENGVTLKEHAKGNDMFKIEGTTELKGGEG